MRSIERTKVFSPAIESRADNVWRVVGIESGLGAFLNNAVDAAFQNGRLSGDREQLLNQLFGILGQRTRMSALANLRIPFATSYETV